MDWPSSSLHRDSWTTRPGDSLPVRRAKKATTRRHDVSGARGLARRRLGLVAEAEGTAGAGRAAMTERVRAPRAEPGHLRHAPDPCRAARCRHVARASARRGSCARIWSVSIADHGAQTMQARALRPSPTSSNAGSSLWPGSRSESSTHHARRGRAPLPRGRVDPRRRPVWLGGLGADTTSSTLALRDTHITASRCSSKHRLLQQRRSTMNSPRTTSGTVAVCPVGWDVEWHFVANQTEGATEAAYRRPDWGPSIGWQGRYLADKVNRNVQHFWVSTDKRVLLDAKVPLPGKLVLSDWSCVPPPPCSN